MLDEFLAIRQIRRMEFRWSIVAAIGVLAFGTLQGIVIAIIVSLNRFSGPDRLSAGIRDRPKTGHECAAASLERAS